MPAPRTPADYFLMGSVAAFVTLVVLSVVLRLVRLEKPFGQVRRKKRGTSRSSGQPRPL